MRKALILGIALVCLWGCASLPHRYFAEPTVIENVANHVVAIAVYFTMPESEYNRRIYSRQDGRMIVTPVQSQGTRNGEPIKCIAYIGSGTIGKENHIITVRHLFVNDTNTYNRKIWVMKEGVDHPLEADVVAISQGKTFSDDYAVIKLRENLGLPGIPVAKEGAVRGEKVIFGGSLGGSAFFIRFGYLTQYKWFFRRDDAGQLHLAHWEEYSYNCIYPSGPGDSGSGVFNVEGKLVAISYCGTEIYAENYVFSNPLTMLHDFLEAHGLSWLKE